MKNQKFCLLLTIASADNCGGFACDCLAGLRRPPRKTGCHHDPQTPYCLPSPEEDERGACHSSSHWCCPSSQVERMSFHRHCESGIRFLCLSISYHILSVSSFIIFFEWRRFCLFPSDTANLRTVKALYIEDNKKTPFSMRICVCEETSKP